MELTAISTRPCNQSLIENIEEWDAGQSQYIVCAGRTKFYSINEANAVLRDTLQRDDEEDTTY